MYAENRWAGDAEIAWEEATKGGTRSEGTLKYGGAGDEEIAWEEATEGSAVRGYAGVRWGWRCRNSMGGGYGGGARSEGTVRYGNSIWEEATEGERGRRAR